MRQDTIIALASGAGRAGIAVIRASGNEAAALLIRLAPGKHPPPRQVVVRELRGSDGEFLDEALVLFMPGPGSFTGEDVVEFHVHGGTAIIESVLIAALETCFCRLATPGEFTRRAFESGRLDLAQAEGVADLIDAETEGQRRQAARLYRGEASRSFEQWRGHLISAMATLEASIDFPDESDVASDIHLRALIPLRALAQDLEVALVAASRSQRVREGFSIAIIGPPNAGKSSLMNRLAGRDAAIVSPTAGTTRDIVEARRVFSGHLAWIADTAGLRQTDESVEVEGVRRARLRAEEADLRLWVLDGSAIGQRGGWDIEDVSRETLWRPGDLIIVNKIDLARAYSPGLAIHKGLFRVSALTGAGLEDLEGALTQLVVEGLSGDEAPLITRARHKLLVEDALESMYRAIRGFDDKRGMELVSEDLRLASRALGRITGAVDVDDLLDRVFADFCIGK
ncbi:MAG: tRNA uridine-5-carboxymethylaminomethyl(34) synthesis GTPase MnmE [Alphaproteobacteria bacterium]|nr:tRNA uridine-5-carboxymethylaminomethyl(34) synthesis GTPase MnmE [Alphaproteobacteria bacterium]